MFFLKSLRCMAKYWYRIRLSRSVNADQVDDLKSEVIRLFQSTDPPRIDGEHLEVTTSLNPPDVGVVLDRLSIRHGALTVVAGSRKQ